MKSPVGAHSAHIRFTYIVREPRAPAKFVAAPAEGEAGPDPNGQGESRWLRVGPPARALSHRQALGIYGETGMRPRTRNRRSVRAIVLVADGFDEVQTVACVSGLRDLGAACQLISLTAGLVTGAHGLAVHPDASLEAALTAAPLDLLLFPSGAAHLRALSLDARVWQLAEALVHSQGVILVTAAAAREAQAGSRLWEVANGVITVQGRDQSLATFLRQSVSQAIQRA